MQEYWTEVRVEICWGKENKIINLLNQCENVQLNINNIMWDWGEKQAEALNNLLTDTIQKIRDIFNNYNSVT